jgi:hypothetical protein
MAETVVINIEANTQGLQSTIDLLVKLGQVEQKVADDFRKTNEKNVKSLQSGVQQTTTQFQKLDNAVKNIGTDNKLAESLDATAPLVKTGNSIKSFRQQLKDATTEAILLAQKFGDLDPRAVAAAQKVADLKDLIGDTNAKINALNPENKFKAIQNLGGAIAGIFQVATGALQAFGVESEQATKIAQQFQGALNIFGGLQQLAGLKDSLTAVKAALGLTTAATVTQTTANEGLAASEVAAGTAATGAAGAVKGLTASLAANPYFALAAAVLALGAAFVALSDDSDNVADTIERLGNQVIDANNKLNDTSDSITRGLDVQTAQLETQAQVRKNQGASVKELANIERERYNAQAKALQDEIAGIKEANHIAMISILVLRKQQDEEANKKADDIQKEVTERNKQLKDLTAQAKVLAERRKAFESDTTKAVAEEAEKQKQERLKALDVNYQKALEGNKRAFALERLEASKTIGNELQLRLKLTEITIAERQKELEIAKKFGKDTIAIEQDIVDKQKDAANQKLAIVIEGLDAQYQANIKAIQVANTSEEEINKQSIALKKKFLQDKLDQIAIYQGKESELYKKTQQELANVDIDATIKTQKTKLELLEELKKKSADAFELEKANIILNSKTLDEANAKIAEAEKKRLETLIATAKAQGLTTTELEAQLKLINLTDADKLKDLQDNLKETFRTEVIQTFFDTLNSYSDQAVQDAEDAKDERLKLLDEEDAAIQEKFENRLIGRRQLELEQEKLAKQRVAAEEQAEKRIAAIRKRQDLATRAKALFEIAINTRKSITAVNADPTIPAPAKPFVIALYLGIGAAQAAAVIAQPLPKYKQGTLAVGSPTGRQDLSYQGGRGTISVSGVGQEDTELALLQPGEAVIPTATNRAYHPAIKAIYEHKIKPSELNQFVTMRLRGDISRDAKPVGPVMAKMDTADLYALGRIIRKNDGVTVKNIKELASIFADSYNPRR